MTNTYWSLKVNSTRSVFFIKFIDISENLRFFTKIRKLILMLYKENILIYTMRKLLKKGLR